MKHTLSLAFMFVAAVASADFTPSIRATFPPAFPPPGETGIAICAGEVCADGEFVEVDAVADPDCFLCVAAPTDEITECTGTGLEVIGPWWVGEGAVSPCDGCASVSTGDIGVRGGQVLGTNAGGTVFGECTADAADNQPTYISGADSANASRSGAGAFYGNEYPAVGGLANIFGGDVATGNVILNTTHASAVVRLTAEDGATDNTLTGSSAGYLATGNSGDLFSIGSPLLFRLNGSTSGTVDHKAAAVTTSWVATEPPNDGDSGQVLTTDGSGVETWTSPSEQVATVTLSQAQLLALGATPVTLVAAPAAGHMLVVTKVVASYKFNSVNYVDASNGRAIAVFYAGGTATTANLLVGIYPTLLASGSASAVTTGATDPALAYPSATVSGQALKIGQDTAFCGGAIVTSSLNAGGLLYANGDTGQIDGGAATYTVTSVDGGGAVTGYTINSGGAGYAPTTGASTTATTGIGGGFAINILTVQPLTTGDGTLQITTYYSDLTLP